MTNTEPPRPEAEKPLLLVEELHVLLLDRKQGGLINIDDRNMRHAFAGAVLMDLAKERRIDTDLESLEIVDPTPLEDEILNPLLSIILTSDDKANTVQWVERLAVPEIINRTRRLTAERLARRGIFSIDPEGGVICLDEQVSRTRRYPGLSASEGQDVALRVMNVIFSEDIPSPDEAALIALVDACGAFELILTKSELAERRERIDLVRNLDIIGQSIHSAVLSVRTPETRDQALRKAFLDPAARIGRERPPMAPGGLPLIGHSLSLRPTPTKALADYYRSLGPVFRIRDLARDLTVLAGPEANLFCQKNSRSLFRSHDTYAPLFESMDAERIILSMDGEEHFSLRRAISSGFSGDRFLSRLPEIRDIILAELPENGKTVAIQAFSQLTAKSIGLACTGYALSSAEIDDIDFFMRRVIAATVLRVLPKFMMRTPRARRAKDGFFEVFASMLRERLEKGGEEEGREDVVDAMLALHRSNPQFLPERELRVSCLGPIFSGLHTTASTGTSAMCLLLMHPDVMERVRAEADDLYADGGPDPEKVKALDATGRTILETIRLHNPFGTIFRRAVNGFDFGGYGIPAGARLLLPTAVPHYCPEFFPDPDRFDIDRYLPERAENDQPGVYMPFGFGTHRCLGSVIANAHLVFSLATILHYFDVKMDPPDYVMKFIFNGVPALTKGFRLELTRRWPNPADGRP